MAIKSVDNSGANVAAKSLENFKIQSQQSKVDPNKQVNDLNKLIPAPAVGKEKTTEAANKPGKETEKANLFNSASSEIPKIIEPKTNIFEKFASKVEKIFNPEKAPDTSKEQGSEKTKATGLTDATLFAPPGDAQKVQADADAAKILKGNKATLALVEAAGASNTATT